MFGYVLDHDFRSIALLLTHTQRCMELLRQSINYSTDLPLNENVRPDQFSDQSIRACVEKLQFRYQESQQLVKPVKRLKVSDEPSEAISITREIGQVLQIDLDCEQETAYKTAFLYVTGYMTKSFR